jgi:hypothetical protein
MAKEGLWVYCPQLTAHFQGSSQSLWVPIGEGTSLEDILSLIPNNQSGDWIPFIQIQFRIGVVKNCTQAFNSTSYGSGLIPSQMEMMNEQFGILSCVSPDISITC